MSTVNMKQAKKWSTYYGVTCQLIEGKNPLNCQAVIVNGKRIATSNMNGLQLEMLFSDIACGQHVDGSSVAKQKINEAHGRTNEERLSYFIKQLMTYANRFDGVQFIGQSMESVLNQMVKNQSLTLTDWVKGMQDWHGSNAKALVYKAIKNKEIHVIDESKIVICDCTFRDFIKEYAKQNQLRVPTDKEQGIMIDTYLKGIGV